MEDWDSLAGLLEGIGHRMAIRERDESNAALVLAAAAAMRARAALRVGDVAAARRRLAEAAWLLAREPEPAPLLREWLGALRTQADAASAAAIGGGWSLTSAELRVLQLLPTHLSFPDIARRLFVSPNTVKTHLKGIFGKLCVSRRVDAVRRGRQLGLC
jgi:LuxR family maltose regulon positive regulatory protein